MLFVFSDSGVLYIHVHSCQGLIPHTSKTDCQPYCVIRQGPDVILRTSSLLAWEKGTEILIKSCRGLELTFEVLSDGGALGSDDSLGWTTFRLSNVSLNKLFMHLCVAQIKRSMTVSLATVHPSQRGRVWFHESQKLVPGKESQSDCIAEKRDIYMEVCSRPSPIDLKKASTTKWYEVILCTAV